MMKTKTIYYSLKRNQRIRLGIKYYNVIFIVKARTLKNMLDNEKFHYRVIYWCANNLKHDFKPSKIGLTLNLIISTPSKLDEKFLVSYWTKDIVKKDVYRFRNLKI